MTIPPENNSAQIRLYGDIWREAGVYVYEGLSKIRLGMNMTTRNRIPGKIMKNKATSCSSLCRFIIPIQIEAVNPANKQLNRSTGFIKYRYHPVKFLRNTLMKQKTLKSKEQAPSEIATVASSFEKGHIPTAISIMAPVPRLSIKPTSQIRRA